MSNSTDKILQLLNEIKDFDDFNPPTNDTVMTRLAELDDRFKPKEGLNSDNSAKVNQLAKYMAMIMRPDKYK